MKVLIADDHAVVRQGLRQILATDPDMVVAGEAKDGAEAISMARNVEWDVAVLDFSMPGLNGLDLLGEMKKEFPKRPVLILSMHPEDLFAVRTLRAGASAYVEKDSPPEALLTAIRRAAAGGTYVSEAVGEKIAASLGQGGAEVMPHERLSDREFEVLRLLGAGKSVTEVANALNLSVKTVSTHRTRIMAKTGLHSTSDMVDYVIAHRLR